MGITFHGYKQGMFFCPTTSEEQNRLDPQQGVFRLLLGGYFVVATVGKLKYVLDVAAWTGIWALDLAGQNPDCTVIGTDPSRIQPSNQSPNCQFAGEDSEDPWIFPVKFDYVHLCAVVKCFEDVRTVMRHAFNMNEGGWIELQDLVLHLYGDDQSFEGMAIQRWT
ncbi:uncharacterized protein BCR38DRAFT_480674 [Pseudomassariella vexata]|uniref:S-adenosyl-L-methionine-dependent methyltransferase n=1 Tax=Pseudomassariella vexata TaxID=1141098 RepID=A0A1Y2EDJ7_9PEZI|nr:uncharacterized protein BCR38DRAFT_480674 [Pseudomassariella vexata]ORY69487.1 hypothetical protein BCR38DRAFT_480674 [Pseudomassariella vexata]